MKLIDADNPKLRGKLKFIREAEGQIYGRASWGFSAKCEAAIDDVPPVDAVPVVRCKDCLYNRACEIQYHAQAGDLFFCGAAERKDGEQHD